jgi:uncharacterized protein (TIGR02646 family)
MRAITKGPEPTSLAKHRATKGATYDDYRDKEQLRSALVRDQGGLCCYCMGAISAHLGKMKIEHWRCRTRYPKEQLIYRNLLGACLGGHGQPYDKQHCDTRKGDSELLWNPADPEHAIETRIRFERDGTIRADDPRFNNELEQVLNLNLPLLKKRRAAIARAIAQWWKNTKAKYRKRRIPDEHIERKIQRHTGDDGNLLKPYCQVAVFFLIQKLNRKSK